MTLRSTDEYTWGDIPYRIQRDCLEVRGQSWVFFDSQNKLVPYFWLVQPTMKDLPKVHDNWYKISIRALCLIDKFIRKIEVVNKWFRCYLKRLRLWKEKHALAIVQLTTLDQPDVTSMIAKYLTS